MHLTTSTAATELFINKTAELDQFVLEKMNSATGEKKF